MNNNWRYDKYLGCLSDKIDNYELYSFDMFDTLIFRRCERPVDVFAKVWDEALKHFPEQKLTTEEYVGLRREAERIAGNRRYPEHGFESIFKEMDFERDLIEFLKRTEIEIEKNIVYLNESVYSMIRYLYGYGKIIILVSDMYHSENTLREVLKCAGIDLNYISEIFVSSEFACRKVDGALFEKVLERYSDIDSRRMIHIGDNEAGDFEGAKSVGANAILYGEKVGSKKDRKVENLDIICKEIERQRLSRIAVFAAGYYGRLFLKMALSYGIEVSCFIDNSPKLWGRHIDNLPVCPLEAVFCECLVVATVYAKEIRKQLELFYLDKDNKPKIYYFDGEDIL